jgi:hypothetical protein
MKELQRARQDSKKSKWGIIDPSKYYKSTEVFKKTVGKERYTIKFDLDEGHGLTPPNTMIEL